MITMNFNLDLKVLKSVCFAMDKEKNRYFLMGVHIFERDGNLIYEATNGHFAIRVGGLRADEDLKGLDIIIPDYAVRTLIKQKGYKSLCPAETDGKKITFSLPDFDYGVKCVDATFPNVDRVIPEQSDLQFNTLRIDGLYLGEIAKSIKVLSCKSFLTLHATGDTYGDPILVKDKSLPDWIAVIMPVTL